MKKISIYMLISLLLFSMIIPAEVLADNDIDSSQIDSEFTVKTDDEEVPLYEDIDLENQLLSIPDDSSVVLLEVESDEISLIEYIDDEDNTMEGYVENQYLFEEMDQENEDGLDDEQLNEEEQQEANEDKVPEDLDEETAEDSSEDAKQGSENNDADTEDDNESKAKDKEDQAKELSEEKAAETDKSDEVKTTKAVTTAAALQGYAQKQPTAVYQKTSTGSKVLKTYPAGHLLKYRDHNSSWYIATVYLNGKATTGYIHKNDVGSKAPTESNYAQKNPTYVYASNSKSAKQLKSYTAGHLLKYHYYNSSWYETTVYVNGKAHTGYIHKDDVGSKVPTLSNYAQKNPTYVYASNSKSAKQLKSYTAGHLLKYHYYNSSWYETTVYVNGKAHKGYIHKNDVGSKVPTLSNYAQKSPTHVYASNSRNSKVLKSYTVGHLLKYHYYNSSWFETTVYVNGKAQTGYIHKNDVGAQAPLIHGFAKKQPTKVYSSTSTGSKVLKSYKSGHLLKYRPYNSSWYIARVFIDGKAQTGYIKATDVVDAKGTVVVVDAGHGGSDPGASANGLKEKDINLELALKLQKSLTDAGFTVIMTRTTDKYLSLKERTNIANNAKADLFVSIHVNSGGGTGIETWWQDTHEAANSKKLAESIQNEMIKETKANDRGIKHGNLHVNRESKMPSSLVEVGFIDHKDDAKKLKQTSYKNQIVKGIASGVKKYFGF